VPELDNAVLVGSAFAIPFAMVPALIVVAPLYVLAESSVSVPAADFINAKLPLNNPANESDELLFTVNMAAAPLSVTVPLPVTLATCCA